MPGVLILDANQRSALAATRSLGRRGVRVVVADETRSSLAGASRFAARHVTYPSPSRTPNAFVEALRTIAAQEACEVVLPMTDVTTCLVARHREDLAPIKTALPSAEAFEAVSDKWRLSQRAAALGIPTPRTHLVTDLAGAERFASDVGFPIVVKPRRSRFEVEGRWVRAPVEYARDPDDLRTILGRRADVPDGTTLLQAFVQGRGQGIFGLYAGGRPVGFFAHRRLRERPPSGGVSVLSESVPVDPRLQDLADRLLGDAAWHGVAMVEFKVTPSGQPYLIEVNGRFWGSLQLAVDAGVDFPYLAYRLALGNGIDAVNGYTTGLRSRWLLGDVDSLYLSLVKPSAFRATWRSRLGAIAAFLRPGGWRTRHDVNRWDDLGPFIDELRAYILGGRR